MAYCKTIPALGRPFALGMLYDRRSEKLILSHKLWSSEQISSTCETVLQTSSNTEIFSEDTIDEKASAFGLDESTKLSLIGKLVHVDGAAKYLEDRKSSSNQVRIVLKNEKITKEEKLTMAVLGQGEELCSEAIDEDIATDVVVGITYGSNTFLVFDKDISKTESVKEAQENMKTLARELTKVPVKEKDFHSATEGRTRNIDDIKCTLYSDIHVKETPGSYEEAEKVYKQLSSLIGENEEQAVPLKVCLLPLSEIKSKTSRTVHEVSTELVHETCAAKENLESIEALCNDIVNDEVCTYFQVIKKQLITFRNKVIEYNNCFQKQLSTLLPEIRGEKAEESRLKDVLSEKECSPFAQSHMNTWMEEKRKELKILKGIVGFLKETPFVSSLEDAENEAFDPNNEHVLCYTVRTAQEDDAYIVSMGAYLNGADVKQINSSTSLLFKERGTVKKIRESAVQFMKFKTANENNAATKFLATEDSVTSSNTGRIGGFIYHYEDGSRKTEDFQPPYKPGKPVVGKILDDAVELQWTTSMPDIHDGQSYEVQYLPGKASTSDWISQNVAFTKEAQRSVLLAGLRPATTYNVRIRSICPVGVSEFSDAISVTTHTTQNDEVHCNDTLSATAAVTKICLSQQIAKLSNQSDEYQQHDTRADLHGDDLPIPPTDETQQATASNANEIPSSTVKLTRSLAPGKPHKIETTTTSIAIGFTKPASMTSSLNIEKYKIEWRVHTDGQLTRHNTLYTNDNSESFTIKGLEEGTSYNFRVTAIFDNAEESETSNFSDSIQTLKSPSRFDTSKIVGQCEKIQECDGGVPAIFTLPLALVHEDRRAKQRKYTIILEENEMNQEHVPERSRLQYTNPLTVTEKVIMAVGATGAGKTTLLNGMVNHILGVRWKDNFRLKMIHELSSNQGSAEIGDQTQSQTQYVSTYTLPYMPGFAVPYTLTIVDTPGFGDTRGIDHDSAIIKQIHSFFSTTGPEGIDHVDAICFLVQAGNPRLTPTQQYVFDRILSMFGKDIKKNICVLFTFADGQKPQALASMIKADILGREDSYFKFNNSALFVDNSGEEEEENFDRMFWRMGIKSFDKFFTELGKLTPRSLVLTQKVLDERAQLEVHLNGIQNKINCGLNTLSLLQQEQRIFNQHAADINANVNFKYVVYEDKRVQVKLDPGRYTTNCLTCNYTCHYPCGIPNNEDKSGCWAMTNGKCRECPNKCDWSRHINDQYRYETQQEAVQKEFDVIKDKYETALQGQNKAEGVIRQLKDEFEQTEHIVLTYVAEMQRGLNTLSEIALKKDPLQQVDYLDLLISSETSQARPGWKDRVDSLRETRKKAEQVNKLARPDYDPWQDYRENEITRQFFKQSWGEKFTETVSRGFGKIKSAVFGSKKH